MSRYSVGPILTVQLFQIFCKAYPYAPVAAVQIFRRAAVIPVAAIQIFRRATAIPIAVVQIFRRLPLLL